jgi:hypothetical protein
MALQQKGIAEEASQQLQTWLASFFVFSFFSFLAKAVVARRRKRGHALSLHAPCGRHAAPVVTSLKWIYSTLFSSGLFFGFFSFFFFFFFFCQLLALFFYYCEFSPLA